MRRRAMKRANKCLFKLQQQNLWFVLFLVIDKMDFWSIGMPCTLKYYAFCTSSFIFQKIKYFFRVLNDTRLHLIRSYVQFKCFLFRNVSSKWLLRFLLFYALFSLLVDDKKAPIDNNIYLALLFSWANFTFTDLIRLINTWNCCLERHQQQQNRLLILLLAFVCSEIEKKMYSRNFSNHLLFGGNCWKEMNENKSK